MMSCAHHKGDAITDAIKVGVGVGGRVGGVARGGGYGSSNVWKYGTLESRTTESQILYPLAFLRKGVAQTPLMYPPAENRLPSILILLVPYQCSTGGDFRYTLCPYVGLSDYPSVRPSAKSGSCDNLKTVWSLPMKLGKWTDGKVEIMHVLLFCSSTINFDCYVNLKILFH